jgi:hypothetical protein
LFCLFCFCLVQSSSRERCRSPSLCLPLPSFPSLLCYPVTMADDISSITATPKLGIRVSDATASPVPPVEPSISSVRPDAGSQPSFAQEEKFAWPPLADDLKRLYLEQKLSASKIAKIYGLNYASEKTAESTILYHLKRNGIARRDPAAHLRKVTDAMVEDWIVRYQKGESLKQIAGILVGPVTVFNHLHKRGLSLRDKVEAQIKAVTIHEKKPFQGSLADRAYLAGITRGDFSAGRHGRAVRVRLGTTHPDMADLFRRLSAKYGPIYEYPKPAPLPNTNGCWTATLTRALSFWSDPRLTYPSSSAVGNYS